MPLSPTTRFTGGAGADNITSSSFTPSNDSLLVVVMSQQVVTQGQSNATISDTASLTWTKQDTGYINTAANEVLTVIWTAPVVTGTSMTVTATAQGSTDSNIAMSIVEFTGYNTSSPVGFKNNGSGENRTGAYSLSLGGTTSAASYVVGGACTDDPTTTPGTGWTTMYDGTPNYVDIAHQYKSGAMSTADWDAVTTTFSWAAVAIEIKAGAPTINTEPADASAYNNDTANFTVSATASSGSLTYQWQVSTDRCATYSNVSGGSGGTTSSYTTASLAFSDHETFYRCAVTDSNGTTNTRGAALRIKPRASGAWVKAA
jgi:hypothetical protein